MSESIGKEQVVRKGGGGVNEMLSSTGEIQPGVSLLRGHLTSLTLPRCTAVDLRASAQLGVFRFHEMDRFRIFLMLIWFVQNLCRSTKNKRAEPYHR